MYNLLAHFEFLATFLLTATLLAAGVATTTTTTTTLTIAVPLLCLPFMIGIGDVSLGQDQVGTTVNTTNAWICDPCQ